LSDWSGLVYRFQQQLQTSVAAVDETVSVSWEVGSECVVFIDKEQSWYRAIISEINTDAYKVAYLLLTFLT